LAVRLRTQAQVYPTLEIKTNEIIVTCQQQQNEVEGCKENR
jgi:hypothetical protein